MRTILTFFLILLLLLPVTAIGKVQTITHTVKQTFGGSQSPDDARISTIAKAKREALEKAAVYVETLTVVKNAKVDKDEILALTAGVVKAEVVSQQNYHTADAFGIEIVVNVVVDISVLEERVKKLLQDRTHLTQLKETQKREKEHLQRVAQLEEESRRLTAEKQDTNQLKKEFQQAFQGLTAVDWFYKADALWDGEKYTDPKKAVEYLSNSIKLQPYNAETYHTRGYVYDLLGQYQRAIENYNEAIRLKPHFAYAYNSRGMAYSSLGQYQRAIEDFDEAIGLQPDLADAYLGRELIYGVLGQYQRAIEDFNEAILLKPDYAKVYLGRGNAYAYLSQYYKAREDFDKAIRLRPDYFGAYYNYACMFALQKDATQACNLLERAIERGYKDWKRLEADKDFDNIRNEECFVDIINKYVK